MLPPIAMGQAQKLEEGKGKEGETREKTQNGMRLSALGRLWCKALKASTLR